VFCLWTVVFAPTASWAQSVDDLYFKAWIALRAGQTLKAETILGAVRKSRPDDPRPYLGLGDLAFFRREYARSIQFYGKALSLNPSNLSTLVGLGKWAYFSGDREGARRRLREVLSRAPNDMETRVYLAYLGEQMGWPPQVAKVPTSENITRGETAGILAVHLADAQGHKESPFTEVLTDISSHWARNGILNAVRKGWMKSRPDHTFGPGQPLTRIGLAEVVYNIFLSAGVRPRVGQEAESPEDVGPRHPSLQAVLFAVGRGLVDKKEEGKFLPLGPVSGLEAIETLERAKRLLYPTGLRRG
jgi:tetratricopeptide (TPR) repeat protein